MTFLSLISPSRMLLASILFISVNASLAQAGDWDLSDEGGGSSSAANSSVSLAGPTPDMSITYPDAELPQKAIERPLSGTSAFEIPSLPNLPHNYVNTLFLQFHTGNDDLRGGTDNVHARVRFRDGTSVMAFNLNKSQTWDFYTVNYVSMTLQKTVEARDIESITIITQFLGGFNGDNWDMIFLDVVAGGIQGRFPMGSRKKFRFTGDYGTVLVPLYHE